ncbi:calcium-binding protein [Phaeobacter sp. QD34_3]|uniref:calcium-binding protein n=1 Tax=unclassified Phaeobacter TaxID=2621772 RepID=UPI00237F4C28|nr:MULTISPECIES: calcium-binding protein [unclassified Phaeobacter]MDE4132125.1 calcium-binding protein [Phaeobacter sp. QD34_3]MDE4135763.1 calcium-binding protein [Phaeobacter sp. QD34_24]
MSTITIHDPSGSHVFSDLFVHSDLVDAVTVRVNSDTIEIRGSNGHVWRVVGDFPEIVPYDMSVTSITLLQNGERVASVQGFSLGYFELIAYNPVQLESFFFESDDRIVSHSTAGEYWETSLGNDRIELNRGNDTVDGGSGTDTFILRSSFSEVEITRNGQGIEVSSEWGTDQLRNVEILALDDRVINLNADLPGTDPEPEEPEEPAEPTPGTTGADYLEGGGSNDMFLGLQGDDEIQLRGGDDLARGGAGNDVIFGGDGADQILGNRGRDSLYGGDGDDRLLGHGGADYLDGGDASDTLRGGKGKDTLRGNDGDDRLAGGAGRDVFVFRSGDGNDTITDFELAQDRISIETGARQMTDLSFEQDGQDVVISFDDVSLRILDTNQGALLDAELFIFGG